MSLLLKRCFPRVEDFNGDLSQLHAVLTPSLIKVSDKKNATDRFMVLMDHGITIFLPGEEPDPYASLMDSTPFMARFGQSGDNNDMLELLGEISGDQGILPTEFDDTAEGAETLGGTAPAPTEPSDAVTEGQAIPEDPNDQQAQILFRMVFRSIIKRLRAGCRFEIMPGRYWKLLDNKALAAELVGTVEDGGLLLEERVDSPDKPLPDAVYCLHRLEQSFLADLMKESGAETEESGPDIFGEAYDKDIKLHDITDVIDGDFPQEDDSNNSNEPWEE